MGHFFGSFGLFVWASSLLLIGLLAEKGDASISLTSEIQEIKEILRQREAADLQQRAHISRLTESLQVLTTSMERYVTMLEDGQTQGGSGANSCSLQLALVQNRLTNFQDSVTEQLSEIKGMLGSNRLRPGHSTTPPCNNTLTGIQRITNATPRRRPYWRGFWGRDAMREDSIIYVGDVTRNPLMMMGDNHFKVESIKEYSDEEHLFDDRVGRTHNLAVHCRFQSIIIRNRRLYCARMDTTGLLVYNLDTDQLIMQRALSFDAKALYEGNTRGEIDLSADASWVWMIYAPESRGHLHLDKLDPESLETVATWETHIPQGQVGETFMMCGVIYSLNSLSDSPTYVKHMYSPWHETFSFTFESSEMMAMHTVNRHCINYMFNALITSAEYDHRDQTLYVWNCGYLEKYPVQVVDVDFSTVTSK